MCQDQLVSDGPIYHDLRDVGNQIVARCSLVDLADVTVFVRQREQVIEYYIAHHTAETIIWINEQRPDVIGGLNEHRARNVLCEEYWFHIESFPAPRFVGTKCIQKLKYALGSLSAGEPP